MAKKQTFDLQGVAELARIELTEKERREFGEQINKVLGYFDILEGVRRQKLEAKMTRISKETVLREDKLGKCLLKEEALQNAPAAERGFVKVKAVFTDETQ